MRNRILVPPSSGHPDSLLRWQLRLQGCPKEFVHTCNPVMKQMLASEIGKDVTIAPGSGNPVNCHSSVLRASSAVLGAMLNTDMTGSSTNTISIPEMTEHGVQSFLDYIYVLDVRRAVNSPEIALELLQAGHKYGIISNMASDMKNLLLERPTYWFDLKPTVQLFVFARTVYGRDDKLTMKAAKILKSKFVLVEKLDCYKEIFRSNQVAAMDLCYLFAVPESNFLSING